jgi:hypothetical protein
VKRVIKLLPWVLAAVMIVAFALIRRQPELVRAQEPTPSPTPINQHWRVEHGSIEELSDRLRVLNNENIFVPAESLIISQDGKRFVITLSDEPPCEDCEE